MPPTPFPPTRGLRAAALAAVLGAAAAAVPAATLTLDAGGRLLGATGVVVAGVSYDVSFVDGTCAALYGGCDAVADFAFTSLAQAHAASTALVSQVFNAAAATDADPTLTRGCESSGYVYLGTRYASCYAITPFGFTMDGQVATHVALNDIRDSFDMPGAPDTQFVVGRTLSLAGASGTGALNTYAVWSRAGSGSPSPASAPGSALLAGLALLVLAAGTRRSGAREPARRA